MYESSWYNSGQLVPDQVTPANDELPIINGTAAAGNSTSYSRGDHIHPQQLTYDNDITATKFIKTDGTNQQILLADGSNKAISDFNTSVAPRAFQIDPADGIRIARSTNNYCGIYLAYDPNSTTGTLSDQWNISVFDTGELKIGLGAQINQANRGLMISADGNTLSFNGSIIAGTGATSGASNGSVNYSAGNPILWGMNSTDTNGGFQSNGTNICWRARPITLGSVPP
ncbi:MAG: hypothetical protein EZS28_020602 [Streblomastix strix]|uniref:Uncharacterized protein n=1 Tax=Streblomastix strix TaxID=222440 RepID=A0A5J4VMM1_9EUKA|nr:MAG: hypothetical protein EZS28_020602 [Streblomastix strix]